MLGLLQKVIEELALDETPHLEKVPTIEIILGCLQNPQRLFRVRESDVSTRLCAEILVVLALLAEDAHEETQGARRPPVRELCLDEVNADARSHTSGKDPLAEGYKLVYMLRDLFVGTHFFAFPTPH